MLKTFLKKFITTNGIAYTIGILGSIASILTVFISKFDTTIKLKWFLFTVFVFLTIVLILVKLLFDILNTLRIKMPNKAKALRYEQTLDSLLVEKNDFLGHSALVSIFYINDSFEIEFAKGFVSNIQEKFIQIKITGFDNKFAQRHENIIQEIKNNNVNTLDKIIIKSYITNTSI